MCDKVLFFVKLSFAQYKYTCDDGKECLDVGGKQFLDTCDTHNYLRNSKHHQPS